MFFLKVLITNAGPCGYFNAISEKHLCYSLFLGREHYIEILPLIEKKVNSNVLSLNAKLFRTKVDIKSVIRDYALRNYVVNV